MNRGQDLLDSISYKCSPIGTLKPPKLKKEGTNIHFWHLVNYFIQNEDIFWKSSLTYTEVNCNNLSGKDHVFNFYSEFMGEGELLGDHNPPNIWVTAEPNTIRYLTYKKVCK